MTFSRTTDRRRDTRHSLGPTSEKMRIGEVCFADYFSAQGDADEIRTFRRGGRTSRTRQSVPFAPFLFAITAAEACIGERVVIESWYRRGLRPTLRCRD